jgi:sarcosine oxidase
MQTSWDVIVVGLGAMGSATLHQLARRGQRVLGIDQFTPPHARGSSHGKSRIIREAYFEDPRYVPLVQRAYERWRALEVESGRTLLMQTGGLMLGAPDSAVIAGARLSAELHRLPHEVLPAAEVRRRFPAFRLRSHEIGVFEPRAGMVLPELAIDSAIARHHGAAVHTDETMLGWEPEGALIRVTTSHATYTTSRLVLSVGAWVPALCRELAVPFTVQRNVLYWFAPRANAGAFAPSHFPIFIHEVSPTQAWYGFPDTGDGVKLALHHHGEETAPDALRHTVSEAEVAGVREIVREFLPDADGQLLASAACMYTNVPDDHFIIDRHPASPAVIVASPCSGHGFKFASAIGDILADMAMDRAPDFDLSLFSLARFAHRA